jgi:HAD superfamily hydrolase (TIGR01544 family)
MRDIIIQNQEKFDVKLQAILIGGIDKFHVRMDFDGTVTKAVVDGKVVPSLISVLRDEDFLGSDYSQKAHALYKKYHMIEIDPGVSDADKKIAMREWWQTHFELLIEKGFSKSHIGRALQSARIQLRGGFGEFAAMLAKNKIPLVIMSCSGMGADMIKMVLEKNNVLFDNMHIITNQYEWNGEGLAVAVKEPIVHTLNKDEESIERIPGAYEAIKNRPNVLLLTDSVADITMADGAKIDNLLSVGFLNVAADKQIELFAKTFDAVLANDASMDFPNDIVKKIRE